MVDQREMARMMWRRILEYVHYNLASEEDAEQMLMREVTEAEYRRFMIVHQRLVDQIWRKIL